MTIVVKSKYKNARIDIVINNNIAKDWLKRDLMKLSISGFTLITGSVVFSSNVEFALSTIKDLLNGAGSGYVEEVLDGVSISP